MDERKQGTNDQKAFEGDSRLEQLHRVMLMMLKDFSAICEKEGLAWFGAFGTALGALRHKGFIPWDDDIDICMPRADLDELTAVVMRDWSDKYEMINAQIDPHYPMFTYRMMLRGTEFRDSALATMEFDSGIFLDLFALDNLADDEHAYKRQAWRAWLNNKLAIAKLVKNPYIAGHDLKAKVLRAGTNGARLLLNMPGVRSIDFNKRALIESTRYNAGPDTERLGYLCDTSRFSSSYNRCDLFPVRMVPFEDMEIPIAKETEKLLGEMYGDFMTPPPADQRREHYPDILDFGDYSDM